MRETSRVLLADIVVALTLCASAPASGVSSPEGVACCFEERLSLTAEKSREQHSVLGALPLTQLVVNPEDTLGADDDRFGWAISADGAWMIVGAPSDDTPAGLEAGTVYFFKWNGVSWGLVQSVRPFDAEASAWFGYSVSIDGDTAIVGSLFKDHALGSNAGAAYVYVRDKDSWVMQQQLIASDPDISDEFGHSVSVLGNLAVIGAIGDRIDGMQQQGAAYVFVRSNNVWTQQQKLVSQDRDRSDVFGWSVAIASEEVVVVGAPKDDEVDVDAGAAYIFWRSGDDWLESQKVVASDGSGSDKFGISLSVSGSTLLIGAYGDDNEGGSAAGSAYFFSLNGHQIEQSAKVVEPGSSHRSGFGYSVNILSDQALIGAPLSTVNGATSAGFARLFFRRNGLWLPGNRFELIDAAQDDLFGSSVALSLQAVAVGAYFDDSAISSRQDVGSVLVGVNSRVFSDGFEDP